MKVFQARAITAAALAISLAGVSQGAIYLESGDTGQLPAASQDATGTGPLLEIRGSLIDGFDVDMFRIWITAPSSFLAQTLESPFFVSDPQLFLFDSSGAGVYMNDDGDGLGSQSFLPPAHPAGPFLPGFYYLAIGWFDNEPLTGASKMFLEGPGANRPDPATAGMPLTSWNNDFSGRIDLPTDYVILVDGVTAIPEPGTLVSVGLGFGVVWKYYNRRRKK